MNDSPFSIEVVLKEGYHPMDYNSRILSKAKVKYYTYDK